MFSRDHTQTDIYTSREHKEQLSADYQLINILITSIVLRFITDSDSSPLSLAMCFGFTNERRKRSGEFRDLICLFVENWAYRPKPPTYWGLVCCTCLRNGKGGRQSKGSTDWNRGRNPVGTSEDLLYLPLAILVSATSTTIKCPKPYIFTNHWLEGVHITDCTGCPTPPQHPPPPPPKKTNTCCW